MCKLDILWNSAFKFKHILITAGQKVVPLRFCVSRFIFSTYSFLYRFRF